METTINRNIQFNHSIMLHGAYMAWQHIRVELACTQAHSFLVYTFSSWRRHSIGNLGGLSSDSSVCGLTRNKPWVGMRIPCNETDYVCSARRQRSPSAMGQRPSFWHNAWLAGVSPQDTIHFCDKL